jgi:hypothetical protein
MTQFIVMIFEIVKAVGQYDRFSQRGPHFSLKIENPPFMPLVIEAWDSPVLGEQRRISVAHYFEQGGDLVPDPEVEITDTDWPIRALRVAGPGLHASHGVQRRWLHDALRAGIQA